MQDILTPDFFIRRKPDTHLWQTCFRSSRATVVMFTGTVLECETYIRLQKEGVILDKVPEASESLPETAKGDGVAEGV